MLIQSNAQGWWTFRYCHQENAQQVHYSSSGVAEQTINLGNYHPEEQPEQTENQVLRFHHVYPDRDETFRRGYYAVRLTGGDICTKDFGVSIHSEIKELCLL